MKQYLAYLGSLLLLLSASPALAQLNVFACEPEWATLTKELGGESVDIYTATTAHQDPHHIQARPSLIAKVRRADLVVCSGAELEIGWLPLLLRQAGNSAVLPGRPGYIETSDLVKRLEVPQEVDREMGDIHATGNPHVHLDPYRLAHIAKAISERLVQLDSVNANAYRSHFQQFDKRWRAAIVRWEKAATSLKGVRAVVHHKDWVYLFDWLGIIEAGTLEPKPGLPATVGHQTELKRQLEKAPAQIILHTAYQNDRAARRLSEMTGIPVVALPYTVGGNDNVTDLYTLFDDTIERLLKAIQ